MMSSIRFILSFLIFLLISNSYALIEGFYADLFDDEGTQIMGVDLEEYCEYIGYSFEHLNTSSDKAKQAEVMIENPNDANGYLLYPDGEPRFAIIYYHGGYMGHSSDLGAEGRKRVRDHYYHGGSQFGSCAGSYMLSTYWQGGQVQSTWFQIWPGEMDDPNASSTYIDHLIPEKSPLIGYFDFTAGSIVEQVRHNNGGSVDTANAPEGTIFCSMHNSGTLKGYCATWAWKDHDTTGAVLGSTGHPEGKLRGQTKYICAMMYYLTDNLGRPDIKHQLENNTEIVMDKETADNMPNNTKIGDKQYHHFIIPLENPAKNFVITLDGEDGYDFHLFAAQDTFAFNHSADYADSSSGSDKVLRIDEVVPSCTLYVGVKLATTVTATSSSIFPEYSGKLEVLNGIQYSIKAAWDITDIVAKNQAGGIERQFIAHTAGNMVYITLGNPTKLKRLQVFDARGRRCHNTIIPAGRKSCTWQPPCAGIFFIQIKSGNDIFSQRITVTR